MQNLIDKESGEPTPEFQDMVYDTVNQFVTRNKQLPQPSEFIAMAIMQDGRTSFWGFIDMPSMPEEDLYIEIMRRFYAGYKMLGEETILGFGLVDYRSIISREPMPKPPGA